MRYFVCIILIILAFGEGYVLGWQFTSTPQYHMTKDIYFEADSCEDHVRLANGEVTSSEWIAHTNDKSVIMFSNADLKQDCKAFHKIFGVEKPALIDSGIQPMDND